MTSTISTILFDMDGVIADSEPHWSSIDTELLARYGHVYTDAHKQWVMGKSFPLSSGYYIEQFELSMTPEELTRERKGIAHTYYTTHIEPFEHVKRVLDWLRQHDLRIGLATSAESSLALPFLERHHLLPLFDVLTTGEEVTNGKPAPDIYLLAAKKLEAAPDNCLVVEDALAGVQAGKSAGMRVVAIPDAQFVNPEDYRGKADYILNDLGELPSVIESINAKN
ncbi:MAG TPA: HAD family phosphatase [Abditibacteriaceae bacterium]|nr:HAD family phosphatase [Abditibacteriaceae bacterium]